MAKFLALTSKGLGNALAAELSEIDIKALSVKLNGVLFESNWSKLYEAHLHSKIATRFLLPVLDFSAYSKDDLYFNAKKHDFTKYLKPNQKFVVVAKLKSGQKNPGPFRHQVYLAQLFKDVIVDQFYEKYSKRPDVDKDNADVQFFIKVDNAKVSISVDTTGNSLSKRGYRLEQGEAPIREHLAAGLLKLAKWNGERTLVDPMCGSGTFLIEAALMLKNQITSKDYAFKNFQNYRIEDYNAALERYKNKTLVNFPQIIGYDQDPRMIEIAKKNIKTAGLENSIKVRQLAIKDLKNEMGETAGMIVTNPPYGHRLYEHDDRAESVYETLSEKLKSQFSGWDLWLLSGNAELTKHLKMKSNHAYSVFNGTIECRWLNYKIN